MGECGLGRATTGIQDGHFWKAKHTKFTVRGIASTLTITAVFFFLAVLISRFGAMGPPSCRKDSDNSDLVVGIPKGATAPSELSQSADDQQVSTSPKQPNPIIPNLLGFAKANGLERSSHQRFSRKELIYMTQEQDGKASQVYEDFRRPDTLVCQILINFTKVSQEIYNLPRVHNQFVEIWNGKHTKNPVNGFSFLLGNCRCSVVIGENAYKEGTFGVFNATMIFEIEQGEIILPKSQEDTEKKNEWTFKASPDSEGDLLATHIPPGKLHLVYVNEKTTHMPIILHVNAVE
jgi:hypothetical protein